MSNFGDVFDFHEKFGLPCNAAPKPLTDSILAFRYGFLLEEANEYHEGWSTKNLVAATDALLDLVYVAIGSALFVGIRHEQWRSFSEVKIHMIMSGFVIPKKPEHLTTYIHNYFYNAMIMRIALFHEASIIASSVYGDRDPNAMVIAITNLKSIVSKCYMAAVLMGVPWEVCWQHVQAANMAKIRAGSEGDSKRKSAWDVVKPAGWRAPDMYIAGELGKAGWMAAFEYDDKTGKVTCVMEDK